MGGEHFRFHIGAWPQLFKLNLMVANRSSTQPRSRGSIFVSTANEVSLSHFIALVNIQSGNAAERWPDRAVPLPRTSITSQVIENDVSFPQFEPRPLR